MTGSESPQDFSAWFWWNLLRQNSVRYWETWFLLQGLRMSFLAMKRLTQTSLLLYAELWTHWAECIRDSWVTAEHAKTVGMKGGGGVSFQGWAWWARSGWSGHGAATTRRNLYYIHLSPNCFQLEAIKTLSDHHLFMLWSPPEHTNPSISHFEASVKQSDREMWRMCSCDWDIMCRLILHRLKVQKVALLIIWVEPCVMVSCIIEGGNVTLWSGVIWKPNRHQVKWLWKMLEGF